METNSTAKAKAPRESRWKRLAKHRYFRNALALLVILFLRENGILNLNLLQSTSQATTASTARSTEGPHLNATRVVVERDNGTPFVPKVNLPEDQGLVTVRYRITTSLSPWRWLPLYKFGKNQAQITYLIWMENGLSGSGVITSEVTVKMMGTASALDYKKAVTKPLFDQMMLNVRKIIPAGTPVQQPHLSFK